MTADQLPKMINPLRLAMSQQSLEGAVSLALMPRLAEACGLGEIEGAVDFKLSGRLDEAGFKLIQGEFKTKLSLVCQRCMQPFDHELAGHFTLSPVKSEAQADSLPSSYEALMLDDEDEVNLAAMLEDELLLCIPSMIVHDQDACQVKDASWVYGDADRLKQAEEKQNPFADLAKLKLKN